MMHGCRLSHIYQSATEFGFTAELQLQYLLLLVAQAGSCAVRKT